MRSAGRATPTTRCTPGARATSKCCSQPSARRPAISRCRTIIGSSSDSTARTRITISRATRWPGSSRSCSAPATVKWSCSRIISRTRCSTARARSWSRSSARLLSARRLFAWYWGHEHRCVLYDQHPAWGLHGRCIGHGGYPYFRDQLGHLPLADGTLWRRMESKNLVPGAVVLDAPNQYVDGRRG